MQALGEITGSIANRGFQSEFVQFTGLYYLLIFDGFTRFEKNSGFVLYHNHTMAHSFTSREVQSIRSAEGHAKDA